MNDLNMALAFAATIFVAGCTSPTFDQAGPGATRQTAIGTVLVDSAGRTLYVYDEDRTGKSMCTGFCAVAWPPALAAVGATPHTGFTLVVRSDGSRQWAHGGQPLYGYAGDNEPGDVKGDGADEVWHAARP